MDPTNEHAPVVGATEAGKGIEADRRDDDKSTTARTAKELAAAVKQSLLTALHYAKLDLHLTPAWHDSEGRCGHHPGVPWDFLRAQARIIVGPTTDPREIRHYFDKRLADPCIHAKPSRLVLLDTDRGWKTRIGAEGTPEQVYVDGVRNFLDFLGGDVGTGLMSRSRRGMHFAYAVSDDGEELRIMSQCGVLLEGVDVRACSGSGAVTVETNGWCNNGRAWVRGIPRIDYSTDPLGVIAGIEDLGPVRFDANGDCIGGLPKLDRNGWPEGITTLPPLLRDGLFLTSGLRNEDQVDPRAAAAWRARKGTKARATAQRHTDEAVARGARRPELPASSGTRSTRPYSFTTVCSCGSCVYFAEAVRHLAYVPAEIDYGAWRNVIFSVSAMLNGSQCGEKLVAEWSNCSANPDRRNPEQAASIYRGDRRRQDVARG